MASKSKLLFVAELMATLETVITYCPNKSVKEQAVKRYEDLRAQFEETEPIPPLGDYSPRIHFRNGLIK